MAQTGKKQPSSKKSGRYQLSSQQQKLIKQLSGKYKKQSKKKKRQIKKIAAIFLIIAAIAYAVWFFLLKDKKEEDPLLADDHLSIHFIDVGQGDSIFLEADGSTMLIDCGEASETDKVISYLDGLGIKKLDCVVATHPHSDHMGGMNRIIDEYDIGNVIIPKLADKDFPTTKYFEKFLDSCENKDLTLSQANIGDIISIGDAQAEIIAPLSESCNNINNYSIGLYIRHGEKSFLLTGDAEKESEKEMLDSGKIRHADVYKAGHHGSSSSSSQQFLDTVSPDYAVISCGAGNSYGHPHSETLERLSEFTDKIYRTDLCGTIVFESDGKNITVSTERND